MRGLRGVLVGLSCAATTACVGAVNSFVPDGAARFAPELLGTWTDSASTERAVITQAGPRQYAIVYTDYRGDTKRYLGLLGRAGARQVLDVQPDAPSEDDPERLHVAIILDTIGPRIVIAVLERDTLTAYLEANPRAIAHRRTKDSLVLTAGSKELAGFLSAYLRRPGALGDASTWIRRAP